MDKSTKTAKLYNEIAKVYAAKFKEPSEHIDEFLGLLRPHARILDIGCGPGIDSNYMHLKGFDVVGIDLSKKMIELAQKAFPTVTFQVGDMRQLDFQEESFDGIFIAYSLFHIQKKDIKKTLDRLYAVCKKDGVVYVAIQEGPSEEVFVEEPLKPSSKMFLNVFSYEEIKRVLESAGFSILHHRRRKSVKAGEFNFTKLFILAKK